MISDELRRFVLTSIPSVSYLEVVLLFQAAADGQLSADEVARALYLPLGAVSPLLAQLCEAGLIGPSPGESQRYRYEPRDAALDGMIRRLADEYRSNLIEVTHLIHDETQRSAIRFADAFKLRRKE